MKSLQLLWKVAAEELAAWCGTSASRDYETVSTRVKHEGESFLTITLADFGKDFTKSLDQGHVADDQFAGFTRHGGLPRFFGGFLQQVFDQTSGRLLEQPSIDCIFAVRQLTLMYRKMNRPCTPYRDRKAIDSYVQCEREVQEASNEWTPADYREFSRLASLSFGSYFRRVEQRLVNDGIRGKHGPGSTADRVLGNEKYRSTTWTWRLEDEFPSMVHLVPNERMFLHLQSVELLEPGAEPPVRVVTVPKTLRTPRIIAMEPVHMQFMQQGLLEVFMDEIKRDDILYDLIGFDDQTPNQRLALEGSLTGALATLDLKEASDRVPNQLVEAMFPLSTPLGRAVQATRSVRADVPGHGVIPLAKFASMGSALCFPVEAFVFFTIILMGMQKALNRPLVPRDIKRLKGLVRVFGDDLIVPKEYVANVISELERFNFRVNAGKSFWTGRFRESCGRDYFDGNDVTVINVKEDIPTSHRMAKEVLSSAATRNRFYNAGMWRTCQWIDLRLERALKGHYPIVEETSSLIGRTSVAFRPEGHYWDRELHHPLVKGYVAKGNPPESILDDVPALLKYFLKRGDEPFEKEHLSRAGRPEVVYLKLRGGRAW